MTCHEGDKVPPISLYGPSLRAHLRQSHQHAVSLILYASARLSVPGWFMSWCHISRNGKPNLKLLLVISQRAYQSGSMVMLTLRTWPQYGQGTVRGWKKEDLSRYKCVDICSNGLKLCPPHRYIYLCECDIIRSLQS